MAEDAFGGGTRSDLDDGDLGPILAILRKTTIFRRVKPLVLRYFVEALDGTGAAAGKARRQLEADEWLYRDGDPADAMYVVLSGRFEERSAVERGSLLAEAGPGEVLGESELFAEEPGSEPDADVTDTQLRRRSAVLCTERGQVFVIPQEAAEQFAAKDPDFMRGLLRSVATDSVRYLDDEREDDAIVQAYFDGTTARLVPAPFECRQVSMYIVYARAPKGEMARFLPDGVRPTGLMPDVFLLVFADFGSLRQPDRPDAPEFRYRETALFVPALAPPGFLPLPIPIRPVAYAPVVYPDNVMATLLGREIFGFRKRTARTYVDPERGRARTLLDGRQVARLTFETADAPLREFWRDAPGPVAFAEWTLRTIGFDTSERGLVTLANRLMRFLPDVPVLNLKQIPGPGHRDGDRRYEVNELVLSPFRFRRIRALRTIAGLDLRLSGNIPFAGAELAAPVGVRVDCDFDLLTGRVLRRYRHRHEPLPAAR